MNNIKFTDDELAFIKGSLLSTDSKLFKVVKKCMQSATPMVEQLKEN
jgi:hypothetical protein